MGYSKNIRIVDKIKKIGIDKVRVKIKETESISCQFTIGNPVAILDTETLVIEVTHNHKDLFDEWIDASCSGREELLQVTIFLRGIDLPINLANFFVTAFDEEKVSGIGSLDFFRELAQEIEKEEYNKSSRLWRFQAILED